MGYEKETVLVVEKKLLDLDCLASSDLCFTAKKSENEIYSILSRATHAERNKYLESNEMFAQLIPYCVFVSESGYVLTYTRGGETSEERLNKLKSIGIGGHVKAIDGQTVTSEFRDSISREAKEEVGYDLRITKSLDHYFAGLIYDPTTPVGRVHLGLLMLITVEKIFPASVCSEFFLKGTPYQWVFCNKIGTQDDMSDYENWSSAVIKNIRSIGELCRLEQLSWLSETRN